MRTKPFTFKKTVKRSISVKGLEVNLTKTDAKALIEALRGEFEPPQECTQEEYDAEPYSSRMLGELYDKLQEFLDS